MRVGKPGHSGIGILLWTALAGCASAPETVTRAPSCAAIRSSDEDRAPAEETGRPPASSVTLGRWLLLYREAEFAQTALDRELDSPVPAPRKRSQVQRELVRLAGIRQNLDRTRTEWAGLARESADVGSLRDLLREASLDSVFGPRLDRAAAELKSDLTRLESERSGCAIERRPAQALMSPGASTWASTPSLQEIPADELLVHAGFEPALASRLAKEFSLRNRRDSAAKTSALDALDWLDPDGRSILNRIEKLRAAGFTGPVTLKTEQPHALWVGERLSRLQAN